jgi:hypothetical protein
VILLKSTARKHRHYRFQKQVPLSFGAGTQLR